MAKKKTVEVSGGAAGDGRPFEEVFEGLEGIVDDLEGGELSLEASPQSRCSPPEPPRPQTA